MNRSGKPCREAATVFLRQGEPVWDRLSYVDGEAHSSCYANARLRCIMQELESPFTLLEH